MNYVSFVEIAYLVSGALLPIFYLPQIIKLWRVGAGIGSYSISKACAQLTLRIPTLMFAIVVVQHSFMTFVLIADVVGRLAEFVVALRALKLQRAATLTHSLNNIINH